MAASFTVDLGDDGPAAATLAVDVGVDGPATGAEAISCLIRKSSFGEAMPSRVRRVLVGDSNGEGRFAPGTTDAELNDTRITFPYASNLLVSLQSSLRTKMH